MSRQRYIQINGKLIPKDDYTAERHEPAGPYIRGDYQPYQSMVTGEMIEGRKAHREHLLRHNVIEIGNEDKHLLKPKTKELPGGLKERLWEVARSKGF